MKTAWVFNLFLPLIGTILANAMWIVPVKNTIDARKPNSSIEMAAVPFIATVLNCLGWTIYSFLKKDPFIFSANAVGILVGIYNTTSCLIIADRRNLSYISTIEVGLLSVISFWIFVMLGLYFSSQPSSKIDFVIGTCTSTITALYYCSPLAKVVTSCNLNSVDAMYLPMGITNMVTALTWTLYGLFGIQDIFVWLPNFVGFLASIVFSILKMYRQFFDAQQQALPLPTHLSGESSPAIATTKLQSIY